MSALQPFVIDIHANHRAAELHRQSVKRADAVREYSRYLRGSRSVARTSAARP